MSGSVEIPKELAVGMAYLLIDVIDAAMAIRDIPEARGRFEMLLHLNNHTALIDEGSIQLLRVALAVISEERKAGEGE